MTNKEYKVRQYELNVREQEIKVNETKKLMIEGIKKAKSEMEIECSQLKAAYDRELIKLEKERVYLEEAQELSDRGFDVNID